MAGGCPVKPIFSLRAFGAQLLLFPLISLLIAKGGGPSRGAPPLCPLRGAPLFEGDLREEGGQTSVSGHFR